MVISPYNNNDKPNTKEVCNQKNKEIHSIKDN